MRNLLPRSQYPLLVQLLSETMQTDDRNNVTHTVASTMAAAVVPWSCCYAGEDWTRLPCVQSNLTGVVLTLSGVDDVSCSNCVLHVIGVWHFTKFNYETPCTFFSLYMCFHVYCHIFKNDNKASRNIISWGGTVLYMKQLKANDCRVFFNLYKTRIYSAYCIHRSRREWLHTFVFTSLLGEGKVKENAPDVSVAFLDCTAGGYRL